MKQIIDGKLYDTEKSTIICHCNNGLGAGDFRKYSFDLHRTTSDRYFACGSGGPMSLFARPAGNMTSGGDGIVSLEKEQALFYAERYGETEEILKNFEIERA